MLLLLLSCSPGYCCGVDWRGLGCMYEMEINYFTHYSWPLLRYLTSPFSFCATCGAGAAGGGGRGCADAGGGGTGWGAVALCERWRE